MNIIGADFIRISERMQARVIIIVAVNFYNCKVLLKSLLVCQRTVFRDDHVDGDGLTVAIVRHREKVVSSA